MGICTPTVVTPLRKKRTFTQFWSGRSMACSSVDVLDWQVGNGWHIKNWYLRTGNWPESRQDNQLSSILMNKTTIRISCNLCVTKKGWYHGFSANTPIGTAVIFIAANFFLIIVVIRVTSGAFCKRMMEVGPLTLVYKDVAIGNEQTKPRAFLWPVKYNAGKNRIEEINLTRMH